MSPFTGNVPSLTIADDLLENDWQNFLEMMEQLAKWHMQHEQQAALEEDGDVDDNQDCDDCDDDDVMVK